MTGGGPPSGHRTADLVLLLVTAGWGATFPAIKAAVAETDAMVFMALRFGLTIPLLFLLLGRRSVRGLAAIRGRGAVLGGLLFASYAFQAFGLETTSATRSAFLTGLSVVIVPMIYVVIRRRTPGLRVMAGVLLSLSGLFLMTRPDLGHFEVGDALTLCTAAAYAFYIVYLEAFTVNGDSEPYIAFQALFMAGCAAALAVPAAAREFHWHPGLTIGLAVTVPVTVVTLIGVTRFQARTTATRAALIYAAEPVFAWMIASVWLGERLDASGLAGVGLILAGVLVAILG